jgi:hypothetical protein
MTAPSQAQADTQAGTQPGAQPGPDAGSDARSTDELKHALVESLMGVIGAPDDEGAASNAAALIATLDARLAAEAA